MIRIIYRFFDKLEDKVRGRLSHYPIFYALIGGIGVVLFWRGIWHTADYLMLAFNLGRFEGSTIDLARGVWWDGPLSFMVGTALLLMVGLFVSNFIGNEIIISGLRGDKKISEKTEQEVSAEAKVLIDTKEEVDEILKKLDVIDSAVKVVKNKLGSN